MVTLNGLIELIAGGTEAAQSLFVVTDTLFESWNPAEFFARTP